MPSARVIPEEIVEPISPDKPAGEDLGGSPLWVKIRETRPNAYDVADRKEWARADAATASWDGFAALLTDALMTRTKDLRLGIWLTEASIKLHGFRGVRDGVRMLREFVERFWDVGLYPLIDDGDLENRSGPLEWLNEKMGEAILEVPLTLRAAPAVNYSYAFYEQSRRATGAITAGEFDAAVSSAKRAQYEAFYEEFEEASAELREFERVASQKLGEDALSLTESKEALENCRMVLNSILRKKREAEPDAATPAAAGNGAGRPAAPSLPGMDGGSPGLDASWAEAERLAREGMIDPALAQMARLAAAEPNGRVRFQRKLLLAEICLNTGRYRLAKSILEELNEQIKLHKLEQWETAEMIGAVWTRLYRCYRNKEAGAENDELAAKLFEQLCRLDPWQALACGEK
jgi:type VI secretion system protein ImpA